MAAERRLSVSVIVTNHDYGRFLPDALGSVLAQETPPLEVLVVDDGSTDDSLRVLRAYGPPVRVLARENGGQAAALSTGVAEARGDILCFLDADDAWTPDKLARVLTAFEANPRAGWLRHRLRVCDEGLRPRAGVIPSFRGSRLLPPDPALVTEGLTKTATSALCLRREAAARVFPLSAPDGTSLRHDADAVLVALLGAEGIWGYSLDAPLALYRMHGGQTFAAPGAVSRLIERQVEVALASAHAFAARRAAPASTPTTVHKHRAVLAALAGRPALSRERLGAAVRGWRAALRLAPRRPRLAARQSAGIAFAWALPERWLRRVLQDPSYRLEPARRPRGAPAGPEAG